MLVHKSYRFRIYPTDEQRILLAKVVGLCRLVYNLALEQRRTEVARFVCTAKRAG
jgi:putative transposase